MGNYYSLYSKNLGLSGKMVWWSTEPNWSTKLGDLLECLKLTLAMFILFLFVRKSNHTQNLRPANRFICMQMCRNSNLVAVLTFQFISSFAIFLFFKVDHIFFFNHSKFIKYEKFFEHSIS